MSIVKLKKVVSRKDVDLNREYHRYDITIPRHVIEDELNWKSGIEIKWEVKDNKLILEKE